METTDPKLQTLGIKSRAQLLVHHARSGAHQLAAARKCDDAAALRSAHHGHLGGFHRDIIGILQGY